MLRRPNAATNARRKSLEVGTGDDNSYKKEFRFPRRQRRRNPTYFKRGFRRRMRQYWIHNPQKALPFAIVCTGVAILVILAILELLQFALSSSSSTTTNINFQIIFPAQHQWRMHKNKVHMPFPWRDDDLEEDQEIYDYGGLDLDFLAEDSAVRNIIYNYTMEEFEYLNPLEPAGDDEEDFAYVQKKKTSME